MIRYRKGAVKDKLLKSAVRYSTLLLLLTISVLLMTGCSPQRSRSNYPNTFEDARKLEAAKPKEALEEYDSIKDAKDGKDDKMASEALLLAAQFASDPSRYGTPAQLDYTNQAQMSPESLDKQKDMQADGELQAFNRLKLLFQQYPNSAAAKIAPDNKLKPNLERRMDERNRSKWNYKLVDALVGMTGRIPAFSYWFALALIAAVVKGITLPLTLKTYKSQREMKRIQPLLKELQAKYKDKPAEMNEKTWAVYKEHGVNPFASCIPMVIQLPFLYGVYYTIRLYEHHFSYGTFLWIGSPLAHMYPSVIGANMGEFDIPLLVLYAASNYLTMKLTPSPDPAQAAQQKQMSVMMTIMMFWMFLKYRWSAAFIFYWLILNILSAWQQYHYIYKPSKADGGVVGGGDSDGRNGKGPGGGTPVAATSTGSVAIASNPAGRARPRRKRR